MTRPQLQTLIGAAKPVFDCCIDLGFTAENTLGNARETAEWARAKGYHRLILVTADYHMPRARLELKAAMPEADIAPYPVRDAGHAGGPLVADLAGRRADEPGIFEIPGGADARGDAEAWAEARGGGALRTERC